MQEIKAEIITIGDEILYGQIVDTNSRWISQELGKAGFKVNRVISVGDKSEEISNALQECSRRAQIILITGGLGPTRDDITKKTIADYFKQEMVFYQEVVENIVRLFQQKGRKINKLSRLQAYIPANAEVITNSVGTAPGMWFYEQGIVYVSMPGIPYEMKKMMIEQIIPKLRKNFPTSAIYHQIIRTIGCPESKLAECLEAWEEALPTHIKLAYLPRFGQVRLRLTAVGQSIEQSKSDIAQQIPKLQQLIGKHIYAYGDEDIEIAIGKILIKRKQTLAIAESCTGGLLSHQFVQNPGCSAYFKGAMVAYNNEIKQTLLGVKQTTLKQHGAVSEQTAKEMAENIIKNYKADYGLATTGIAGPDGRTPEKPVGTIWVAIASAEQTFTKCLQFSADRVSNMNFTQQYTMYLFWKFLQEIV